MVTYTGQRVGYMRVSSIDQNLDRQSLAIGGCDKIFSDKASGRATCSLCLYGPYSAFPA
jgi:hypothetical protein